MKKPDVLYHASPNRNIEIFKPRNESVRDANEGPVVFATSQKDYASCFIMATDDSWTQISKFNSVRVVVVSDRTRFEMQDKGGAIYELPSNTFIYDIRGSAKDEWTSRESVKPIGKIVFDSGLEAMLKYGVQVYFVDKTTFKKITNAEDHGISILQILQSENQKHNINIKQLPMGDFDE